MTKFKVPWLFKACIREMDGALFIRIDSDVIKALELSHGHNVVAGIHEVED